MKVSKVKKLFITLLVLFGGLLLWVRQTVRSVQMNYRIRSLEAEIKKEQHIQTELQMKKESSLSLNTLQNFAEKNMKLTMAQDKDVIVISDGK